MTELRINGFRQVRDILRDLLPFIRFKRHQAEALYNATKLLSAKTPQNLSVQELLNITEYILIIQGNNYTTKRRKTKSELMRILGLTP